MLEGELATPAAARRWWSSGDHEGWVFIEAE